MATSHIFNGKLRKLPGVYSEIKSGINNTPANLDFGKVLIVDTSDTVFSGGAGISGELTSGQNAVYGFDNIVDFRNFIRGGKVWDILPGLFKPFGAGQVGASLVYYVRPFTTVAASLSLAFNAETIVIKTLHEGTSGNGVENTGKLTQGFCANLEAGVIDNTKYRLRLKRGTYTGVDQNGIPYNNLTDLESNPETIALSPEVATVEELISWMKSNVDFLSSFKITSGDTGTGAIIGADLTAFGDNQLFAGGTQTYSVEALASALEAVKNLDYTHILSMDSGSDMSDAKNFALLTHIQDEARFEKILVIGGGEDDTDFSTTKSAAASYDSDRVILVHGAMYEADRSGSGGLREKTSLHKAAYVLGRTVGLEPQTPPTFKGLGYAGEVHKLSDNELESALDAGVLTTYYDTEIEAFVITQGINTLQNNEFVINENGTTHLWSLKRIASQLNKEIEVNMKKQLLGNQNAGPNRNTLSEAVVEQWVENYLSRKTARQTVDNLIISFRNIVAAPQADSYWVSYEFEPNFEVNKMFVTGFMVDPNL